MADQCVNLIELYTNPMSIFNPNFACEKKRAASRNYSALTAALLEVSEILLAAADKEAQIVSLKLAEADAAMMFSM